MLVSNVIVEKFNDLCEDLYIHYSKVKIVDSYDNSTYTIIYLNNDESFDKFRDAWENMKSEIDFGDFSYDDILDKFREKYEDKFDFIELGVLDIFTDRDYELRL